MAIGTMYPGGIPGPGLIFEACVLVDVRRCRGVRCSTCATTCAPSPFVVSLSMWVSRSYLLLEDSPADIVLAFKPGGDCDQTSAGPPSVLDLLPTRACRVSCFLRPSLWPGVSPRRLSAANQQLGPHFRLALCPQGVGLRSCLASRWPSSPCRPFALPSSSSPWGCCNTAARVSPLSLSDT